MAIGWLCGGEVAYGSKAEAEIMFEVLAVEYPEAKKEWMIYKCHDCGGVWHMGKIRSPFAKDDMTL